MKIRVWCNSGANIHSKREETIDLETWWISDEEWEEMPEEEKFKFAEEWAYDSGLEIGWSEGEDD
jgi:hypothetical protein